MKKLVIVLCLVLYALASHAQYRMNVQAYKSFRQIQSSICEQDTLKAIQQLMGYEKTYPLDGNIITTNKILGDLLMRKGKIDDAIKAFRYAIEYKPESGYLWRPDSTACDKMLRKFSFSGGKADICISLSQAYIFKKNFDSSLYYLNLADDKYLPYKGCANGVYMYRSYLSTFFANHYLAAGDTLSAINRLLDFFMEPDGNMKGLTTKLKRILLTRYTQLEIKKEVQKGLDNMVIVNGKKDEPDRILEFKMFNHTIRRSAYSEPLTYWKKQVLFRESIQQLLN